MVAPAGAVDGERLAAGIKVLEAWGVRVEVGSAVLDRHNYLAGADDARRADLERMLGDPRVRAIVCARGGYGSQRLVPSLDFGTLARDPKPIVGYSDATALLTAAVAAGVVAIHGPMVADDLARGLAARSEGRLRALLMDADLLWDVEAPETVTPGRATGHLMGGCLSVLVSMLGTPYAPDTDGAILFLEDVAERPYRLDRLLTQLRQAGKLDRVAGVVFGTMAACPPVDGVGPLDVVRACCDDLPCPIAYGLPAGHDPNKAGSENMALPFGVQVTLDADRGRLTALEPAVV
ncbi:MAG TPA: LD-carboxypeptidase [Candidatus Binatia bacterium]|nr:LD-carboxypeptidase [Candidatus Binatia bacterium]